MKRKKLTKAEREELDVEHARILENARRTRELAEKGRARLQEQGLWPEVEAVVDPADWRAEMLENARRTRQLAEKAQAELDSRRASA